MSRTDLPYNLQNWLQEVEEEQTTSRQQEEAVATFIATHSPLSLPSAQHIVQTLPPEETQAFVAFLTPEPPPKHAIKNTLRKVFDFFRKA